MNTGPSQAFYKLLTALLAVTSACAALLLSSPSFAKDYKVEAILFKNESLARTFEPSTYEPPLAPESNAPRWKLEPSMLLDQYQAIQNSSNYLPLLFESWGQESLPKSAAAVYPIVHSNAKGWIRVYARDLLFIQLDLDVDGYRLTETRRVKLNEKHFFDHPKFGLLMQVSRLEKQDQEKTIQTSR